MEAPTPVPSRHIIQKEFEGFIAATYNNVPMSDAQRSQLRDAFHAGALTLFSAIMGGMSDGDEPTKADEDMLASIATEFQEFEAEIEKRAFNPKEH